MQAVRGSGQTTRQMMNAPKGSLFLWCAPNADWAKHLASKHGRNDLIVIGTNDLEGFGLERLRGKDYPALVVDHTLRDAGLSEFTAQQWAGYNSLRARVRPVLEQKR